MAKEKLPMWRVEGTNPKGGQYKLLVRAADRAGAIKAAIKYGAREAGIRTVVLLDAEAR